MSYFHARPCKLDAFAKYAPHPNLFLYHESFARTKFRIQKKVFVITLRTTPSITATSTTSIQIGNPVCSASGICSDSLPAKREELIQEDTSSRPISSLPIERNLSQFMPQVQTLFFTPNNPASDDLYPQLQHGVPKHPDYDTWFDGWETSSVKALVLANITCLDQDNFVRNESMEMSRIDTYSDAASSTLDLLPPRVENRITEWLQNVVDQPQESCDEGGSSWPAE